MENKIARNSSVIRTDLAKWGSTCFELLVTWKNSHQLNECMHQRRPNWYMNLCVHNWSPRLSYRNPRLKLSLTQKWKSNLRKSNNTHHRVAHLVGDIFGFGQHFVLAGRHGSSERQLPPVMWSQQTAVLAGTGWRTAHNSWLFGLAKIFCGPLACCCCDTSIKSERCSAATTWGEPFLRLGSFTVLNFRLPERKLNYETFEVSE